MAKIITTENVKRRTIRLTTDDIINIVQTYQQLMKSSSDFANVHDILSDKVFYLPEDL